MVPTPGYSWTLFPSSHFTTRSRTKPPLPSRPHLPPHQLPLPTLQPDNRLLVQQRDLSLPCCLKDEGQTFALFPKASRNWCSLFASHPSCVFSRELALGHLSRCACTVPLSLTLVPPLRLQPPDWLPCLSLGLSLLLLLPRSLCSFDPQATSKHWGPSQLWVLCLHSTSWNLMTV